LVMNGLLLVGSFAVFMMLLNGARRNGSLLQTGE